MRYDALIVGGGPAGSTAALLLAQAGWKVVVFEHTVFPRRKVCGEYLSATNLSLLRRLGLGDAFSAAAGPEITHAGLCAGSVCVEAPLPRPHGPAGGWGRAWSREHLDMALLEKARAASAEVRQPWSVKALQGVAGGYVCRAEARTSRQEETVNASVVIAAHGSWEHGALPTQVPRLPARPSDLLGFKAHLKGSALPLYLMPLLAFPDGYGGLVHADGGRVSLSCCIRRDRLERLPRPAGRPAGEAVLGHILDTCPSARPFLEGVELESAWLSAGPIRPGLRTRACGGIFAVGNAAGEAHPVVAEGISMAMQSAWLLAVHLAPHRAAALSPEILAQAGVRYAKAYRSHFLPRIRSSAVIARLAMQPLVSQMLARLIQRFPALLTRGSAWSGKANEVVPVAQTHRVRAIPCRRPKHLRR